MSNKRKNNDEYEEPSSNTSSSSSSSSEEELKKNETEKKTKIRKKNKHERDYYEEIVEMRYDIIDSLLEYVDEDDESISYHAKAIQKIQELETVKKKNDYIISKAQQEFPDKTVYKEKIDNINKWNNTRPLYVREMKKLYKKMFEISKKNEIVRINSEERKFKFNRILARYDLKFEN
jgi:hypothetical protein